MNDLYLTDAMNEFKKKLDFNKLNIINTFAGSGKTHFIFNDFLNNTYRYTNTKNNYIDCLNKILYVCDTTMLKESILKDNPDITKTLNKGDLKKAKTIQDDNKIIVITYNTLGFLLNNTKCKYLIDNYFNCIILDEIHNLIKFSFKFKDKNSYYNVIMKHLNKLSKNKNLLLIGLTATPNGMYYPFEQLEFNNYNVVFNLDELKRIKHYTNEHENCVKDIVNEIKKIALFRNYFIKSYSKILIYTNTISVAKKYKEILINGGFKAEYLCSLSNNKLNDEQLYIRDYIINNNKYPYGLDVLIINGAYETGWNLKDNNVKWVLVDSIQEDIQIQARSRVRNNIVMFIHKDIFRNGILMYRDKYKNEYPSEYGLTVPILASSIDSKYINIKLSSDDKRCLVKTYGTIKANDYKVTWKSFKEDIEKHTNYKVITCRQGTYIINKDEDIKNILKGGINNMNNDKELIKYLNDIVGIKLNKQEQKELINNVGLKDTRGRLQKSINILNTYLIENYNKTLISKQIMEHGKRIRYWILSELE